MTIAPAQRSMPRIVLTRFGAGVAMLAAAILAGCAQTTVFDDLNDAQPTGTPFAQAQFRDYSALARSFGTTEQPSGQSFDAQGSMSLTGTDATTESLAIAFAQKALTSARGEEPLPEAAPDGDADAEAMRLRLLRGLDQGRDKAPDIAARAEADFDCWILNGRVDMQKAAAQQCRRSLDVSLAQLERAVNISSQPAPMPAPVATTTTTTTTTATTMAAPAAATTGANYQVYFDFDSWSLTAEDLTQISQAVAAAKAGAQSRVTIVGHTDTSGSAEYNLKLSERRAGVVKDTMVQMGARPEAIQVSGVGKSDLAVQTADGVKEARNRRAVITLLP
jgi:outer membrane protein OmpA-like peptidoglycan-associated protein